MKPLTTKQLRSRCPVVIDISEDHTLNSQLLAMTGDGWNKLDWTDTLGSGEITHKATGLRVIVKPRSHEKELLAALESLVKRSVKDAEIYAPSGNEPIWAYISDASDAIAKARGEAAK